MIFIGTSWLVFWLLVDVFDLEALKAALVTGIIFVVAGLLVEGLPTFKRQP